MSPRKVRLVVDLIRGISVDEAERRLMFLKKDASRPVLKLLQSAIANAQHNFKLDRASLFVKTIMADGGPTLKRSTPRAMGRATPIRKRTTHITLILAAKDVAAVAAPKKASTKKAKVVTTPTA